MARVTVEDCLDKVHNRFALVMLAVQRVRQLKRDKDAKPLVRSRNKEAVTALREVAAGKVEYKEDPLTKNPYSRYL
ncbi:MAG: DNA-directed RNA polymerase subunit omega [Myxococcales bacterium]|nr:DNA-directed RNA polymerase subunit omega [Myxococcales bacterium]MCB9641965.1 DNA-directed RNA polymerase subunit omega [Myxococcales bacterium]